jgi:hypothetical protein
MLKTDLLSGPDNSEMLKGIGMQVNHAAASLPQSLLSLQEKLTIDRVCYLCIMNSPLTSAAARRALDIGCAITPVHCAPRDRM